MNESTREVARRLQFHEARSRKPSGVKMTASIRSKANRLILKKGLDGNGRFTHPAQGVSAALEAVSQFGIEMDDISMASRYTRGEGSTSFRLAWTNPEDHFSPKPIPNAALRVSWTELEPHKYEVIIYVT